MSDFDQPGEELDEMLTDEFPPEEPLGVDDQGVTGIEQLGGESVEEREERTEPEVWEGATGVEPRPPVLQGEAEPGEIDEEEDLVAPRLDADEAEQGPLAPDDEFTGDETTRDVATERVPMEAEDAAVHLRDTAPGGTP